MNNHVVIAARGGPDAKTRLAARLDTRQRDALVAAMLADMLDALGRCRAVSRTYVTTPTPALARLAARSGAVVLLESGAGDLNASFESARRRIAAAEPDAIAAILPGDLPNLDPQELDLCLQMAGPGRVILVPALADGGTGALAAPARLPLPLAFGPGSLGKHLAAARTLGIGARLAYAASLGFDLDRPSDLDAFLRLGGAGRTAEVLLGGASRDAAA
jgi:2-phospho-L-lactate guanylyltransferase